LVAKSLDGMLQHNTFMSKKAKDQANANVVFATLLSKQKNLNKTLSDSVACLGRDYPNLNDKVDQSHTTLDYKITGVHNKVNNINDNINSMKSQSATAAATLQMDKMMAFMMHDKTSAAATPAPAAPVSIPAPAPA
jgi:phage shock protein A